MTVDTSVLDVAKSLAAEYGLAALEGVDPEADVLEVLLGLASKADVAAASLPSPRLCKVDPTLVLSEAAEEEAETRKLDSLPEDLKPYRDRFVSWCNAKGRHDRERPWAFYCRAEEVIRANLTKWRREREAFEAEGDRFLADVERREKEGPPVLKWLPKYGPDGGRWPQLVLWKPGEALPPEWLASPGDLSPGMTEAALWLLQSGRVRKRNLMPIRADLLHWLRTPPQDRRSPPWTEGRAKVLVRAMYTARRGTAKTHHKLKSMSWGTVSVALDSQKAAAIQGVREWYAERERVKRAKVVAKAGRWADLPLDWRMALAGLDAEYREACEFLLPLKKPCEVYFFLREQVLTWLAGDREGCPLEPHHLGLMNGLRAFREAEAAG